MLGIAIALSACTNAEPTTSTTGKVLLTTRNTAVFRGVVTDESVQVAQLKLAALVAKRGTATYPLYLVLDSPGGSIDAGQTFIEYAKTIKNLQTVSIFSASMASAIVEQLPGERLMTENGTIMFHRAKGGFQGQFEDGEVESRLWAAKNTVKLLEGKNASRMHMTVPQYKALIVNELWLDASNAVQYRSIDRLVDLECTKQLTDVRTTEVISLGFFGTATLEFSDCPLMRMPTSAQIGGGFKYIAPTFNNYKELTK